MPARSGADWKAERGGMMGLGRVGIAAEIRFGVRRPAEVESWFGVAVPVFLVELRAVIALRLCEELLVDELC